MPVGGDGVGFDLLRVQFGGEFQPGEDLAPVFALQMGVLGHDEMPAKALDPVSGRTQKVHLLLMLLFRGLPLLGGEMACVLGPVGLVKNGGVISAVKGNVGLHKELVGKQVSSVPEQHFQHIVRLTAFVPVGDPFLKHGSQAEAGRQQHEQNHVWPKSLHVSRFTPRASPSHAQRLAPEYQPRSQ